MPEGGPMPRGVLLPAAFFAGAGVLELALGIATAPAPTPSWHLWEALGRGTLHLLLAAGLLKRIAICRSIAMIYCLASLTTYGVILALALGHAPLRYPSGLVVQSLYEVPFCALLFPFLRSRQASVLFTRPLF
jgi:hypothetical protein